MSTITATTITAATRAVTNTAIYTAVDAVTATTTVNDTADVFN